MKRFCEELNIEIDCPPEQLPLVVAALGNSLRLDLSGARISINNVELPHISQVAAPSLTDLRILHPTIENERKLVHAR